MRYYLMYKDIVVLQFDTERKTLSVINEYFLPLNIKNRERNYDMIKKFCSDRLMVLNRVNSTEILKSIGFEKIDTIEICIAIKGLSYIDNYWLKEASSEDTWERVNLYKNEINERLAYVALTGKILQIDNSLGTGELTLKGTKAKCVIRERNGLYLYKEEADSEIASEVLTTELGKLLGIPCTEYWNVVKWSRPCTSSKLFTDGNVELIPCRDILTMYNETDMKIGSNYYRYFEQVGGLKFLKMQLLDYITLNTDRNRDNFGVQRVNGQITGLSPLYDHDSCFKGISTKGFYFVTGTTFENTIEYLKQTLYYRSMEDTIKGVKKEMNTKDFRAKFLRYKDKEAYEGVLGRVNNL